MPWFSRDLLGLEEDDFGIFAGITVSGIDRDTDPELEDPSGTLVFACLGMDYTFLKDETFLLRGQVGLEYGYFGGVTDLDDGVAALFGAVFGVNLGGGIWVSYSPQLAVADAGNLIFFNSLGVVIEF